MPRIRKAQSPLKDLLSALLGAQTGDHLVCEFSCSCCKSSITAAADAICSYLHSGSNDEVITAFFEYGGPAALEVALSSSNELIVCAAIRVIGALLQTTAGSSSRLMQQQDQQQQQQQHGISLLQEGPAAVYSHQGQHEVDQQQDQDLALSSSWPNSWGHVSSLQSKPRHVGIGAQNKTSNSRISRQLWCSLLHQLTDKAAAHAPSAAVRVAALKELEQLLLLIVTQRDAALARAAAAGGGGDTCTSSRGAAAGSSSSSSSTQLEASASNRPPAEGFSPAQDGIVGTHYLSRQSSGEPVMTGQTQGRFDQQWLTAVMQAGLTAMQDSNQDIRRAGSRVLASALVLQDTCSTQ